MKLHFLKFFVVLATLNFCHESEGTSAIEGLGKDFEPPTT